MMPEKLDQFTAALKDEAPKGSIQRNSNTLNEVDGLDEDTLLVVCMCRERCL